MPNPNMTSPGFLRHPVHWIADWIDAPSVNALWDRHRRCRSF